MLTGMTEDDWATVLRVFAASFSQRGAKGRKDHRFLEARPSTLSRFTPSPGEPCLRVLATGTQFGSAFGA